MSLALPLASQVPLDESLLRLPSHLYSGDLEHEINGVYKVLSSLLTKFIHCSRNIIEQVLGARASAGNKRSWPSENSHFVGGDNQQINCSLRACQAVLGAFRKQSRARGSR